jgi:hypothetical protein
MELFHNRIKETEISTIINSPTRDIKQKVKMKRLVLLSLTIMSIMCIASSCLWAPNETDLTPKENNGKWGYINMRGKAVIPLTYDEVNDFSGGVAIVRLNGQSVLIDKTGKKVSSIYDGIVEFSAEGVAKARSDRKIVSINRAGEELQNKG